MITEDYCSYEVAKLLKEKGFPFMANVGALWIDEQGNTTLSSCFTSITWEKDGFTPCVTLDLAMKWLREKDIIIVIQPEYFNAESKCSAWGCDIWVNDNYKKVQGDFPSYEEAIEAAIKYSLENLV